MLCYDLCNMKDNPPQGEIVLYKDKEGPEFAISLADETVWLTQAQMAELFGKDRDTISEHIQNVYKQGELEKNPTTRKFQVVQNEGKRQVLREIEHYNLDMIISVGYRVNSKKGTQFRIWATQKLRDYLLKGYLVNEKRLRETHETRLKELQQAHLFLHQALDAKRLAGYEKELASIINDYTQAWVVLSRYDDGDLKVAKKTGKSIEDLVYIQAKKTVEHFRDRMIALDNASGTFGRERGNQLETVLKEIHKLKGGLEQKAATLFYLIIKNRPFMDGNKRIASLLFIVFLVQNHALFDKKGERKFNDSALVALALLIEETKPSEKPVLIQLISNLILK
jgi:prophage maintenance system killer protein